MNRTVIEPYGRLYLGPVSRIPPGEHRTLRVGGLLIAISRSREGGITARRQRVNANGLDSSGQTLPAVVNEDGDIVLGMI